MSKPDYTSDPEYLKAVQWAKTVDIPDDQAEHFAWVVEYAREKLAETGSAWDAVTNKAGAILQNLGLGGLVGTAITLFGGADVPKSVVAWALVPLALSMITSGLCLWAMAPLKKELPPSIEGAFQFAEHFGAKGQALFLGRMHQAAEGQRLVLRHRQMRLKCAHWGCLLTMVSLLAPVTASLLS